MYMIAIALSEARRHLPFLVQRAERGEEIVLLKRGKAVARIAPLRGAAGAPDSEEAKLLLGLSQGRIAQIGRSGPLVPADWRPGRHGGGLSRQVLRDRRRS